MPAQPPAPVRPSPQGKPETVRTAAQGREIPFNHVLRFPLSGTPGDRHQQSLNVSAEGTWILTAISWSFVPSAEVLNILLADEKEQLRSTRRLVSSEPENDSNLLPYVEAETKILNLIDSSLRTFGFFYTLVDAASGRELQDGRVYSAAGLGRGDGERPFYTLQRPMVFAPRSSLRVEIEEVYGITLAHNGQMHMVMHGYKVLP